MLNAPLDGKQNPAPAGGESNVVPISAPRQAAAPDARPPTAALAYVAAVFSLGVVLVGWFAPQLDTGDLPGFIVFGILALAFGRTRIQIYGDTTVSIAVVGDFAIAFLFGPAGAAIVSPFAALATDFRGGVWYKRLFNIGSGVVVNVAVAAMIHGTAGRIGPGLPHSGWLIPIALGAVGLYYVMNIGLVAFAVSLSTRTPILEVFREKFEWLLPHYVLFGVLGLALAVAYDGLGYIGLLAFIAPPLMMRLSIKQYVDKTAANVDELKTRNRALQKANEDVLLMADKLLSPTERRVLQGLLTGLTEKEIAVATGQKITTLHKYVKSLYAIFGVKSRAALLALWLGDK